MIKLYDEGVYLVNGDAIVKESESEKVEKLTGKKVNKEILERANELIDLVGLTKVKNNMATDLSGGQQQRAAIARALINSPKIILADEPTGNLDSNTTNEIYNILRDINKKYNRIAEKADRVIEVLDGNIIKDYLN